jgi:Domain of unknown function (DUF4845)
MKRVNVKQWGMTAIGFILILLLIGLSLMIVLKVAPIYYENFKIKSVLSTLENEPGISKKTNFEIGNLISHRFIIDNIDRVKPGQVKVLRDTNKVVVKLEYEIRDTLIANIDVVVSFDNSIELPIH